MDLSEQAGEVQTQGKPARTGQVQSLTRALSILNALGADGDGMTLTDISRSVELPPSTTHRLLTTLQNERYVRFDRYQGVWQVGVQAFIVGNVFLRSRDLIFMARPFMEALMESSGETVNLAVADEGEMVYVAQVECREMMRAMAKTGSRVLMHCSAVGKAILAQTDESDVSKILKRRGLPRLTDKTLDTAEKLKGDLTRVVRQGYAVDDEEHAIGLRCVAAPIFNEFAKPMGAISLSGPAVRIPDQRLSELGETVARMGQDITIALGGRRP